MNLTELVGERAALGCVGGIGVLEAVPQRVIGCHCRWAIDVHRDAHVAVALVQDDGDAAIALVLGEQIPETLERGTVRRGRRQLDCHRRGEPFAHQANRHDLRCDDPRRLVVSLELPFHQHGVAILCQVPMLLEGLGEDDDLDAA